MADDLKAALLRHLSDLDAMPIDELLRARQARIRDYGVFADS